MPAGNSDVRRKPPNGELKDFNFKRLPIVGVAKTKRMNTELTLFLQVKKVANSRRRQYEATKHRAVHSRQVRIIRRREQRAAVVRQQRNQRQGYLHNRRWVDPEQPMHQQEWLQEQMAAFHLYKDSLQHQQCKLRKETWPATQRQSVDSNYTCTRCRRHADCSQLRMTWIPVQFHRNYRTSQRLRNAHCLSLMCV